MSYTKEAQILAVVAVVAVVAVAGTQPSWAQVPKFAIQKFAISGNTLLAPDVAEAAVAPFTGDGRSMDDINQAAAALRAAYEAAGYSVVQVFPPEQTAADGVISLRVVEGKLTKIAIEGNRQYDADNIRASLPALKEGTSPNAREIIANIVLANENPAKQVSVDFKPGTSVGGAGAVGAIVGAINATIKVTEDRIKKTTLTYDNAGSLAAGFNRLGIAYTNANVGNRDHLLSLGVNTTAENFFNNGASIVAGYRIPFYPHGISLDLIGSYSDSRTSTTIPGGLGTIDTTGRGTYLGVRLNHALSSIGAYRHKMLYGLDYKDFDNQVTQAGNPLPPGTVTSAPLLIGYVANMATPDYQVGASLTYATNLAYGPHSAQNYYDADTPGASRHWDAWRGNFSFALPLSQDWQFRVGGNLQHSGDRLVNAERFGIGGASSVRGYGERAVNGDKGYHLNLELYTPDFGKHLDDELKARAVLFYDHGRVTNRGSTGIPPVTLASIGVGLRLNHGKDLTIKADWALSQTPDAFQIQGNPIPTMPARQTFDLKSGGDRWGLHLSVAYTF